MTEHQFFPASYFDGQSARKHAANVTVTTEGLLVSITGFEQRLWPYDFIHLGDQNQPLHLEYLAPDHATTCPEILVVDHPGFTSALHKAAPSILNMPPRSALGRIGKLLGLSSISLLLIVLGFTFIGPVLIDALVKVFPYSWESKLGNSILAELQTKNPPAQNPKNQQVLDSIIERLLAGTAHPAQYHFKVHIFPQNIVNALALPGGNIIVFQGLLNLSETSEEIAGVLAHEVQHILLRHATRNIVRESAIKLFFFLSAGELSNKAVQFAEGLAFLNYSREMETAADREGMKAIIASKIDPEGMIRIFEKLSAQEGKSADSANQEKAKSTQSKPLWLKYLSTHPAGTDRVNDLRGMLQSRDKAQSTSRLLPEFDWASMHESKSHP